MNKRILSEFKAFLVLYTLCLLACAKIVSPDGGPKDTTAPVILGEKPPNASTNITGKKIVIQFDEYISLEQPSSILITPFQKETPEIKEKGKKLHIEFKEDLTPNTTYFIDLSNRIVDYNESNPLTHYTFAFSTGEKIDFSSIKGKILDAETGVPEKDILVLLYPAGNDTLFLSQPPRYAARTDTSGSFSINYIANGSFNLYALKDQNNNYFHDQPNEEIAFLEQTVLFSDSSTLTQNLFLFPLASLFKLMENKRISDRQRELSFNLSGKPTAHLIAGDGNFTLGPGDGETYDLWYLSSDTLELVLNKDTLILDTIVLNPNVQSAFGDSSALAISTNLVNIKGQLSLHPDSLLEISSDIPIKTINKENIALLRDSVEVPTEDFSITFDSLRPQQFHFIHDWKENFNYNLQLYPAALKSWYTTINDTIEIDFQRARGESLGILKLKLDSQMIKENPLLRIYSGEKLILQRPINGLEATISSILPNNYNLLIINDLNKNQRWDSGNYEDKLQPEAIYRHPAKIDIRANWETEVMISPNPF